MTTKQKNKFSINSHISPAILVLENKSVYKGIGLGHYGEATGEICFNTSLTGYQEIISDPSYAGQIINFTFPHIGNVGANNEDLESDKIWTRGVIFNSEITSPSNYRSLKSLDEWLKKNKIVGITGLDTRSLTNFIRDRGAPKGTISNNKKGKFNVNKLINNSIKWSGLNGLDLAQEVSTKTSYEYSPSNNNSESLAENLNNLMEMDKDKLQSIGNEGRKNILKKFDVEQMCYSTFLEYKKLIK